MIWKMSCDDPFMSQVLQEAIWQAQSQLKTSKSNLPGLKKLFGQIGWRVITMPEMAQKLNITPDQLHDMFRRGNELDIKKSGFGFGPQKDYFMSDYAMAHHPDLEMSIVQVSAVSNLPDYCYQFNPVPMLLLNKPAVIFQYPGSIVGEWEEEYVTWNGAELKVIFRPTLRKSDFVDVLWQQLFQGFDEPTAKFMGFEPTAITLPGRPSDYFFSPIPD